MGKVPCGVVQNFGLSPIHAKLLADWVSLSVFQMDYQRIFEESAKIRMYGVVLNTSLYFITLFPPRGSKELR